MAEPTGRPPLDDLLARYEGRLLRYACGLVGDLDEARDVVQETFLRSLRARDLPAGDALAPWLFAVCRNCALDTRRRRASRASRHARKTAMQTMIPPASELPLEPAESGELRAIVARLPADQRELIRLKFQEGLTYRQMAQVTGRSASTVGQLLHEALEAIRSALAPESSGVSGDV